MQILAIQQEEIHSLHQWRVKYRIFRPEVGVLQKEWIQHCWSATNIDKKKKQISEGKNRAVSPNTKHKSPLEFYPCYRNSTSLQQNYHTNAKMDASSSWAWLNTRLGFRNNISEENISNKNISRSLRSKTHQLLYLRREPLEIGQAHQEKGRNCGGKKSVSVEFHLHSQRSCCAHAEAAWHSGWLNIPFDICRCWQVRKQQAQNASHRTPPHHTAPPKQWLLCRD